MYLVCGGTSARPQRHRARQRRRMARRGTRTRSGGSHTSCRRDSGLVAEHRKRLRRWPCCLCVGRFWRVRHGARLQLGPTSRKLPRTHGASFVDKRLHLRGSRWFGYFAFVTGRADSVAAYPSHIDAHADAATETTTATDANAHAATAAHADATTAAGAPVLRAPCVGYLPGWSMRSDAPRGTGIFRLRRCWRTPRRRRGRRGMPGHGPDRFQRLCVLSGLGSTHQRGLGQRFLHRYSQHWGLQPAHSAVLATRLAGRTARPQHT